MIVEIFLHYLHEFNWFFLIVSNNFFVVLNLFLVTHMLCPWHSQHTSTEQHLSSHVFISFVKKLSNIYCHIADQILYGSSTLFFVSQDILLYLNTLLSFTNLSLFLYSFRFLHYIFQRLLLSWLLNFCIYLILISSIYSSLYWTVSFADNHTFSLQTVNS